MSITFTAAQRRDITRRQLNIANENAAYANTQTSLAGEKAKLLSVDTANATFYDVHNARAKSYEAEAELMMGSISAVYTEGVIDPYSPGDLSTSAKFPGSAGASFFPSTPTPYAGFIPLIIAGVNGFLNPTGTAARYEGNILSNAVVYDGLTQMIFRLSNGITGASSGTETTTTAIPAGVQTSVVLLVTTTTSFAVNELVYINNGAASGIYQITAIAPATSLTVKSIVHSQLGIGSGSTIKNTVAAFTSGERQTLVSASYQEILTNITSRISSLITEWQTKLNAIVAQIAGNNEDRVTQISQLSAATSSANTALSTISTWQALPNTGVTGKYVSASISPISAEITVRQSFSTTRTTQITTAVGVVSQTGDSYSGVAGSPYYERYKWLNIRINRATGSARRFYDADNGQAFLGMLSANNTAVKGEYDGYFLTKAVLFQDGSTIIHAKDVAGLSVGDTITFLSETQPEIQRAIMEILGTTQIRLDKAVPNTYLVADQARFFKSL